VSDAKTLTLVEFLTAMLDDDEQTARAAGHGCGYLHEHNADWVEVALPSEHNARPSYELRFIKRNSPARVLAEVDAKRRIVEEHGANQYRVDPCDAHDANFATIPCDTLRLLALPYADHEDYDEEWRP
jgi:hypothetical protein